MTEIEAKEAVLLATLRYERAKRHTRESIAQEKNAHRELVQARAALSLARAQAM